MSSSIDKQWMKESDRRTTRYVEGVQKFIEFVVENGGNKEIYSCPCTQCKNMKMKIKLDDIHYHLLRWGIVQSYIVWHFHGEELTEKQKQPVSQAISTDESEHPRMEDLINDADRFHHFQPTSLLPDNIGELSTVGVDWRTNQSKKHKSLFGSAKEPLYPSCAKDWDEFLKNEAKPDASERRDIGKKGKKTDHCTTMIIILDVQVTL